MIRRTAQIVTALLILFAGQPPVKGQQHVSKRPMRTVDPSAELQTQLGPTVEAAHRLQFIQSQYPSYRVNQDTTALPQNEPHVRINRRNRDNLVAAWRDFRFGENPPVRRVGIGHSMDGGKTWTERMFIDTVASRNRQSDPSVAADSKGNFYVCVLSFDSSIVNGNALLVTRSNDEGTTFLPQVAVIENVPNVFEDRQIIWVDDDSLSPFADNIYVSWTRFPGSQQGTPPHILLARSVDGGLSFGPPVLVSDSFEVQGSMPTTGPDGELYVVWEWFGQTGGRIRIDKSTDGGTTFGEDVDVAPVTYIPPPAGFSGGIAVSEYPTAAVDRTTGQRRGHVYVGWADYSSGDTDIWLSKSRDGGAAWDTPVRVNDDPIGNGKDQFFQWIVVDEQGWIDLVFYDRRNDPNNLLVDVYLAQSRDGGQTFQNYRLTDTPFDPRINYNTAVRIGDYQGIDALGGRIVPIFTATSLGSQDIFVSVVDTLSTVTSTPITLNSQPSSLLLEQNYPNPFNPSTIISYSLPSAQFVSLKIYNILGEEVATLVEERQTSGRHHVQFSAANLPSGVYFYRLTGENSSIARKMALVK